MVQSTAKTKVSLIGCDKAIPFKQSGSNIELDLSPIGINDLPVHYLFTFKITNCGAAN